MAENPAEVADIVARWRPLSTAEATVAETHLGDAWAELKHHMSWVETGLDADPATVDVVNVKRVLANMVIRVLRNPDGKQSEQIDDYKFVRSDDSATGELYITAKEYALLAPAGTSSAFSIRPAYVPDDSASLAAWAATQP